MLAAAGLLASLSAGTPADGAPNAPLRVGVDFVPPAPATSEFRLYTPESFDVLIAEKIAAQLGRKLELVQLATQDRASALSRHDVEIVLARVDDTDPIAAEADLLPVGFASGATVAMRTDTDIDSWEDLTGRTVCVSRGNSASRALARRSGAIVRIEDTPAKSLVLVRTGVCDAALHDEQLLVRLFREQGWQKFSATLPATPDVALSAAVDKQDMALAGAVKLALAKIATPAAWEQLKGKWARNVAFEVYLDQDAPDCH
ncbi:transporter substrate-binding domain-containing protein [Aminobacter sp. AP02]|uniref:transporter substrate-binding domain-containing protein n=1 Tax=Aminobacter sp. AP02 TaxID=2135737 RepID=UPI0013048732|nr:transporter substrate-binding domain-containing protein [Aminobacter sp. AP02]